MAQAFPSWLVGVAQAFPSWLVEAGRGSGLPIGFPNVPYCEDALAFKHGWIYEVHWNLRWMFRDHHDVIVID